jgi:hypothetical protein
MPSYFFTLTFELLGSYTLFAGSGKILSTAIGAYVPSTPSDFRRIALNLPETEERKHMNHPDFRVAGKIFATLAYPNKEFAMVKLTPTQQEDFVASHPAAFKPVNGAWGRKGCTSILLANANKRALREAILAAWRNHAPSDLAIPSHTKKASARRSP